MEFKAKMRKILRLQFLNIRNLKIYRITEEEKDQINKKMKIIVNVNISNKIKIIKV
jgi:hypothetical protein